MERLREVLVRKYGVSEEKADQRIQEIKTSLEEGSDPIEVLVAEFGVNPDDLGEVLDPKDLSHAT